jgi:hypothetical protein
MTNLRRYQLENLELNLLQRIRFNVDRIHDERETEEEDLAFYADRAIRLDRILTKVRIYLTTPEQRCNY